MPKEMSQQATAGQGAGRGGGRRLRYIFRGRGVDLTAKGCESGISKIAQNTFNMGHNKFAARFMQPQKKRSKLP